MTKIYKELMYIFTLQEKQIATLLKQKEINGIGIGINEYDVRKVYNAYLLKPNYAILEINLFF